MYKILMTGLSDNLAGLETFVLNCFRHLDKTTFQIDFVKRTTKKAVFEDELIASGSKVIYIPRKMKNLKNYNAAMTRLFTETQYDAVWDNTMRIPNIDFLIYAKKYGVKERILHSHCAQWQGNSIRKIAHLFNRHRVNHVVTRFFSCSYLAADYMFAGKGRQQVTVIPNAVELNKFQYVQDSATMLRNEYALENKVIIGNVGRIVSGKNQLFLLKILKELVKENSDYRVVLIGNATEGTEGYDHELVAYIKLHRLEEHVLFAGSQLNMGDWYSVMDIFVMPSLSEGLPFSAVEAQANGLPCVLSDVISDEVNIVGDVQFVNLQSDISVWVDAMQRAKERGRLPFEVVRERFMQKGYVLEESIKDVERLLLESLNK